MSLKATQDDEQTGKKRALNSSGTESPRALMEEVRGSSTAVIQMTIQPRMGSSESVTVAAEQVGAGAGVDLAELPQSLLDIVPRTVVGSRTATSAYEYVAELEETPVPAPVYGASRPAFSYRSQAAAAAAAAALHMYQQPATYHYTDEGELALEQALAAIVQGNPAPQPPALHPGALDSGALDPGALDPAALYHELERDFSLVDIDTFKEGIQLQSDPPSVIEYSDNGATIQSELFELGQGGLCADLVPDEAMEEPASAASPASEPDMPPLPELPEDSLSPDDQPGPSRPRAHAVQLYPGGGEGEPHTCYITHLPRLAIESTFFDEEEGERRGAGGGGGRTMPLQARPLPSTSRDDDDILRQLLGAPPDEEGEVASSPAASQNMSEDSPEPDKENKPDTISVALRSVAISFASFGTDDSQTIENAAPLTESQAAPEACLCPGDDNQIPQVVAQAEVKEVEASSLSKEREVTSNRGTEDIQSSGLVDSPTNETDSYSMANTLSEEEGLKLGSENDNADFSTGDQEASTLSEDMGRLSMSEPLDTDLAADTLVKTQTAETEAAVPVTLVEDIQLGSVQEKEKKADDNVAAEEIAPIKESDHTSERPTTPTVEVLASSEEVNPVSIASTQAGENVSDCVAQVEVEEPKQPAAVNVIPEEQGADTDAVGTVDIVDTTASTAPKPQGSPKKRKVAAAGTAQIKSKKAKKVVSGANKKLVASGSTAAAAVVPAKLKLKNRQGSSEQPASSQTAFPLKAKTVRKAVMQAVMLSTSEYTDSSDDSNDSKTLAAIIAERNAAAAAAAVEGSTTVTMEDTSAGTNATVAANARADADATSALAVPAMMPAQQTVSTQKAKGKRVASAQYAKPSKKARPTKATTTSMVLRSRSHI